MKQKDVEIEIKVKVEKIKPLIKFLLKNGKLIGKVNQIDTYFSPVQNDFLKVRPVKEWLRLREEDGKYSINYKNWYYEKDGKTSHCDEYETSIGDINSVEKIIKALNIKKIAVVNKRRKIWIYKDYEVAMDEVKNLGNFVEIEYKGEQNINAKKITDQMMQLLDEVGCGNVTRNYQGYPFLILFPKEAKYETSK